MNHKHFLSNILSLKMRKRKAEMYLSPPLKLTPTVAPPRIYFSFEIPCGHCVCVDSQWPGIDQSMIRL